MVFDSKCIHLALQGIFSFTESGNRLAVRAGHARPPPPPPPPQARWEKTTYHLPDRQPLSSHLELEGGRREQPSAAHTWGLSAAQTGSPRTPGGACGACDGTPWPLHNIRRKRSLLCGRQAGAGTKTLHPAPAQCTPRGTGSFPPPGCTRRGCARRGWTLSGLLSAPRRSGVSGPRAPRNLPRRPGDPAGPATRPLPSLPESPRETIFAKCPR